MRELELLNNISNPSVDRPRWRLNKAETRSEAELNIKPADVKCCGVTQKSKGSVREGAKPSPKELSGHSGKHTLTMCFPWEECPKPAWS